MVGVLAPGLPLTGVSGGGEGVAPPMPPGGGGGGGMFAPPPGIGGGTGMFAPPPGIGGGTGMLVPPGGSGGLASASIDKPRERDASARQSVVAMELGLGASGAWLEEALACISIGSDVGLVEEGMGLIRRARRRARL
ncbi:hypothetical protein AQ899_27500 [Burkholderia pseudomallei]|nr:hypothetical protein AQ864_13550 [Burkholderia pseudomallei]OMZ56324.1 hypothetical protein AQ866_15715 [Burkholderia pseudomallei]OMZ58929.1 hypothetical protein AQ867_25530 [Burkholderia pseudomallei]OMZ77466.1 hypothetical protein AQ869_17415 [Burkholderia pseudomallei]OMZ88241.1 hypothetical protein AQ868_01160 [Burkholderia pseudomallei]